MASLVCALLFLAFRPPPSNDLYARKVLSIVHQLGESLSTRVAIGPLAVSEGFSLSKTPALEGGFPDVARGREDSVASQMRGDCIDLGLTAFRVDVQA